MGRAPCCSKVGLNRGAWSAEEDNLLVKYVEANGEGNWRSLPKKAGLRRCGKSCRLRWLNYLRPSIKRGNITPEEEELIIRMHALLGNRWAIIAGRVPGRTDNEIKNYWNTNLSKKLESRGIIYPKIHKSEKKKQSQATQLHLETKSKEQKAQVPQVIAPNVYNPKADLKIHGLKQNEHGVLSPYTNPISMDSSNAASFTPSDAIILHENMHCAAPADEACLDNIVKPPLHQIHNCSNLSGDDGNQHLSSLESQLNAHNSSNQCSNGGHVDDDNDEIGNMFSYILDFGRGENEIPVQNDDGWLQDQQKTAMEYQEELHWDDGVLKQGVGEAELGTDICVNDMAAMWEPCFWY